LRGRQQADLLSRHRRGQCHSELVAIAAEVDDVFAIGKYLGELRHVKQIIFHPQDGSGGPSGGSGQNAPAPDSTAPDTTPAPTTPDTGTTTTPDL